MSRSDEKGRWAPASAGVTEKKSGGRPVLISAEVQAVFLDGLRRGASLKAAAEAAGFALSAFYYRRKADPAFDEAWDEAVEEAAWPEAAPERAPRPFGQAQDGLRSGRTGGIRKRRRLRLRGVRREAFLEVLAQECNTSEAARAAGIDKATVYRLIRRDRGFARENEAALQRGYERLNARAEQEFEASTAWLRDLDIEPVGEITQDFDTQIRLLNRYAPPGPPRPRDRWRKRVPQKWELIDMVIDQLEKRFSRGSDRSGTSIGEGRRG